MNSYTFEMIKKEVLQWCQNHISKGAEYMQLTKNETEIIIIDLTFAHCLAQITINTPIFAPYKYVFFEAREKYRLDVNKKFVASFIRQ